MIRIDCHCHTREHSTDALIPAAEVAQRAVDAGLNGIIFTDHGYCWPEEELAGIRSAVPGSFLVLSGAEIMFPGIHILVYGCPPGVLPAFNSPRDLAAVAARHGGCTVVAHPFATGRRLTAREILRSSTDGLEVFNARRSSFELRNVFEARDLGFAELGGSDFHGDESGGLGMAATLFPEPCYNIRRLAQQIKARATRAYRYSGIREESHRNEAAASSG